MAKVCPKFFRLRLLAAIFLLAFAGTAQGQKRTNAIPLHQPPLSKTFPPKPAEQTPPGTGKFVIFNREDLHKPSEWDFIAGAWECIPSRPDVPITKRIEFCHSSWNATPLLNWLVNDQRNSSQYPRFVRLQVDAGTDLYYSVNLYDINYRTWETRCIWQGSRLRAFGVAKTTVICDNVDEWFSLDALTGTVRKETPFIPLEVDGPYWIVRKNGETSGNWSFDPTKEVYVGHFNDVTTPDFARSLISTDGRNRAWVLASLPDEWKGDVLKGTLLLQRDGQGEEKSVPIVFHALRGSGVHVIPRETNLQFTPDGRIEFAALLQDGGTNDRVWSIEIKSAKSSEFTRPHQVLPDRDFATFNGIPTPDYVRPYLKDVKYVSPNGLAAAFLISIGVLTNDPGYANCSAGISPDGGQILYKTKEGPLADVFIYGDLKTKQTVRWMRPDAIHRTESLELVWVETP